MGDAEIIPLAGRVPRSGSAGSGQAGSQPGPRARTGDDEEPRSAAGGAGMRRTRPALTALLGEVRRLGAAWSRSAPTPDRTTTDRPSTEQPEVGSDPWTELVTFAQSLGLDGREALQTLVDFTRSRLRGDYPIDDFGFDPEFTTKVFLPLLRPLVQSWFRVEVRGAENLPADGAALLVSNHAGTMPLDGMILQTVVYDEIARHVRMLGADLIFSTPYSHDLARKTGTTLACQEDAERLLAADQLVAVFPEGFKGLGKPFSDRYKLQRFGRGGFVSAAVRAQVPIIPVSIVGSEEIYPLIASAPVAARALGLPYFPVTPLFPWLGPLGMVPLPSKWIIEFGEGIATDELPAGAADDPMVVFNVTDQVRETIQQTLYALLMQRRSTWF